MMKFRIFRLKTLKNAVLTRVTWRDFIKLMKGTALEPCFKSRARLSGALLLLVGVVFSGCDKLSAGLSGLFSRGGTQLVLTLVENQESTYQVMVDSSVPSFSRSGPGSALATLKLKVRTRMVGAKDSDGILVQGDVLEGVMTVDGKQTASQLAGQKITYRMSQLRRQSQWAGVGLGIPVGLELFDMGVPNGRIKAGETWKVESDRNLLQLQDGIRVNRNFTIRGEETYAGQACYVVATTIPVSVKKLSSGLSVEVSGRGETWISRKDGRILRVTEALQGAVRNEKQGNQPVPFSQNIEVNEMTVASAVPAPAPKAAPSAAVPAKPAVPAPLTSAPSALPAPLSPAVAVVPAVPAPIPSPAPAAVPASQPVTATVASAPVPVAVAAKAPVPVPAAAARKEQEKGVTVPADSGVERLVFVSTSTGKKEVWSMAVDGTDKRCLTGYAYDNWAPDFDQEGKIMACTSRRANGVNLWFIDVEAGAATPVTDFSENEDLKSGWSEGGTKVVFQKKSKLWAVSRDGFNLQSFDIDGPVVSFDATPDSTQILVVVSVLNQKKIQAVDVNSGMVRDLFEGDMPAWAPKAEKIAFRNLETVNISRADGTGAKEIYKGKILNSPLIWEPGGRKVACTVQEGENGKPMVIIIDEASSTATKVTKLGGYAQAFSPSGDRIAYLLNGDLWLAKVDGSAHIQMTSDGATTGPIRWERHNVR